MFGKMKFGALRAAFAALIALLLSLAAVACGEKQYTLKFVTNGAPSIADITAEAGETIDPPVDPEREGFAFGGWFLTEDFSGEQQTLPTVMPAEDRTYYAKFVAETARLTLDGNGETLSVNGYDVAVGANLLEFLADKAPAAEGLVFGGWYLGDKPLTSADVMPAEGLTITARWKVEYKIRLYKQNETQTDYVLDELDVRTATDWLGAEISPRPEVRGFTLNLNHAGTAGTATLKKGENVFTFYCDRGTFTLAYSGNAADASGSIEGGSYLYGVDEVIIADGKTAFSRSGYRFAGWATSPEGAVDSRYASGNRVYLDANITLYAKWDKGYKNEAGGSDNVYVLREGGNGASCVYVRGGTEYFGSFNADKQEFTVKVGQETLVGMVLESSGKFILRDETTYGMYAQFDYVTGTPYVTSVAYLEGYYTYEYTSGGKTNAYAMGVFGSMDLSGGFQVQYYGIYRLTSYGDYEFLVLNVGTQMPSGEGFYFKLNHGSVQANEELNGYFLVQGLESGTFLQYENGKGLNNALQLDGYGKATLIEYDTDGQTVLARTEGVYVGTDDYADYRGEWKFTQTGGGEQFRFVASPITGSPDYGMFICFNEKYSGTYTGARNAKLYIDGYGFGEYVTADGASQSGRAIFDGNNLEFTALDESGNEIGVTYFVLDPSAHTFTVNDTGFVVSGGVLTKYTGKGTIIEIPDTVTEIADRVFASAGSGDGENIASAPVVVTIPASVTKIGEYAFRNTFTLRTVYVLGETPAQVAETAFKWPSGDFRILVPDGFEEAYRTAAGWNAFAQYITSEYELANRPEFEIANGVLIRYNNKTENPKDLAIRIPDGVTEIADRVFKGITYLATVDLNGVKTVGVEAFAECTGLKEVIFSSVATLKGGAFSGCTQLEEAYLPAIVSVGDSAFGGCEKLVSVRLGASLNKIGSQAFLECAQPEKADERVVLAVWLEGTNPPAMEEKIFAGVIAVRIYVKNIDVALACYQTASWNAYSGNLSVVSGEELGVYYEKSTLLPLVINGRAMFDIGTVWLYRIDGAKITFYEYDRQTAVYRTYEGSYSAEGVISFKIEGVQRTYVKMGTTLTYTNGGDTLSVTLGGVDDENAYAYTRTAHFNGTRVTLNVKPNSLTFDLNGERYTLTLGADLSLAYVKTLLPYDIALSAQDGSSIVIHVTNGYITTTGTLKNVNGSERYSETGWTTQKLGENLYAVTVLYLNDRYTVTVTITAAGSFSYTCALQSTVTSYRDTVTGNGVAVYRNSAGEITSLNLMLKDAESGNAFSVQATYVKESETSYLFTVTQEGYEGKYRAVIDFDAQTAVITMISSGTEG